MTKSCIKHVESLANSQNQLYSVSKVLYGSHRNILKNMWFLWLSEPTSFVASEIETKRGTQLNSSRMWQLL